MLVLSLSIGFWNFFTVRAVIINCQLFNSQFVKAGANIGKLLDKGVAGIFGVIIS